MPRQLQLVHYITLLKLIWTAGWRLLARDGNFLIPFIYKNMCGSEEKNKIMTGYSFKFFHDESLQWTVILTDQNLFKLRAIDRLLKVIKTPHPVPEVCRKAAMILESLVSEPQNRTLLLAYENAFAEILFTEGRYSDTFARILYELTSRPSNKVATARGIWGM